jgi:hypothetical protein
VAGRLNGRRPARLAARLSRAWWASLEAAQRDAFNEFVNPETNHRVIAYLDYLSSHRGVPPVHDPTLDELSKRLITGLGRWRGGPPQWVYRGVRWNALPEQLREGMTPGRPLSTTGQLLMAGDVLEASSIEFVTYEKSYANSYWNRPDVGFAIVFEYLTTGDGLAGRQPVPQ